MFRPRTMTLPAVAIAALFPTFGPHSQDLHDVALAFLKRHGVPCLFVTHVDRTSPDMIATCHDGREWALFFLEGEAAFVQPQTREPYKWRPEVYMSHPEVYDTPKRSERYEFAADDGP
jgi:hypothetical protein